MGRNKGQPLPLIRKSLVNLHHTYGPNAFAQGQGHRDANAFVSIFHGRKLQPFWADSRFETDISL